MITPKPSTTYEAAMWGSFVAFWVTLALLTAVIFLDGPGHAIGAMIVLWLGAALGTKLAQEMHLSNKLPTHQPVVKLNPSEDLFKR
jgi:hypothetical protein